ncbi:MAG: nucleotide sugar dehydrogenase [Clostridiales bacterium]|nr:nucleotide sugar dehydrogenase [Clostridiales bacterium]
MIYDDIVSGKKSVAVVGLGYVGLPIAVEFSKKVNVIGFDINSNKIEKYKKGIDATNEVGQEALLNCKVDFVCDEKELDRADFFIIAVPTPIKIDKTPDLRSIINVSEIVGRHLKRDSIVVYESTVYPGTTEEICVPVLEETSGLKCGVDFKIGYSPERINPSDKIHTVRTIKKIVSACDKETLEAVAGIYELVVDAGVYRASTIRVAEAAKVVENSQRDINIAFMNELAMVFHSMDINTNEVIAAMKTKWNALDFYPGLVGGHCIGVDPYYFIYKAEELGYHSEIIMSGRKINDSMSDFVVASIIKKLIIADKKVKGAKVAVLGITFKENCPDIRNTKVVDIINGLKEYGVDVLVCDSVCDKEDVMRFYGIKLTDFSLLKNVDGVVLAVPHNEYKRIALDELKKLYSSEGGNVLIDVKGIFSQNDAEEKEFIYWSL